MDLSEAIYTTRAMRRLAPDPIDDDVLRRLFDAAVRSPSSGNAQIFRFMTVTDPATKAEVQTIYRRCLTALHTDRYAHVEEAIEAGDPDDPEVAQMIRNNKSAQWLADNLHVAPMLIFVFGKQAGETTTFPALWNLCLTARAEGLGTTITTLLKGEKQTVEQMLGVPDTGEWHMHAMIPIGYPTGKWGVAKRSPANEAVFAETWGQPVTWEVPEPLWPPPSDSPAGS